jgi:ATP-binding cassette subfamily B protein
LAALFVLSLVAPAIKLLSPLPLKIVVDSVIGSHPLPGWLAPWWMVDGPPSRTTALAFAAGLLILVALLGQLLGFTSSQLSTVTGERLMRELRALLFRQAQRLSLSYHDLKGTVDSTYRIQYDAPAIQHILVDGVIPLLTAVLTLAGMILVVIRIDWQLALVALAVSPILFLLTHVYGRRLRKRSKEVKKLESAALSVVQEVMAAVRVVKAFGQESREEGRFVSQSSEGMQARLRIARTSGILGIMIAMTTAVGTAAVLYLGASHVLAGTLTLGELLLVMAYLGQLYGPMETVSKKVADLQAPWSAPSAPLHCSMSHPTCRTGRVRGIWIARGARSSLKTFALPIRKTRRSCTMSP